MTTRERFILTLEVSRPDPLDRTPSVRLRQLLKIALRKFGLRCVECRQIDVPATATGGGE